eukprot:3878969-Pyramimonas_sp.AAC.2
MKGPVRTFACPWPGSGSGEASVRRCLLLTSADAAGGQDAGDDGGGEGVLGVRRTRPKKPQEPGQTPQVIIYKRIRASGCRMTGSLLRLPDEKGPCHPAAA